MLELTVYNCSQCLIRYFIKKFSKWCATNIFFTCCVLLKYFCLHIFRQHSDELAASTDEWLILFKAATWNHKFFNDKWVKYIISNPLMTYKRMHENVWNAGHANKHNNTRKHRYMYTHVYKLEVFPLWLIVTMATGYKLLSCLH